MWSRKGVLAEVIAEKIPTLEETVKWSVENDIRMLFDVKDTDTEVSHAVKDRGTKWTAYDIRNLRADICHMIKDRLLK